MTLPRSSLAVLMAALVVAGCSDSDSSPPMTMVEPEPEPEPAVHNLELPAGDLGSLAAGTLMLGAGDTAARGNVEFSCPAGGDACSIEVMDSVGTLTAQSTGGMATAMMVEMPEDPMPAVHMLELPAGDLGSLTAGMLMLGAGDTAIRGNVVFSCPAGADPCSIEVMDSVGTLTAQSTGGMATASMVPMYGSDTPDLQTSDILNMGPDLSNLKPDRTRMSRQEGFAERIKKSVNGPIGGIVAEISATPGIGIWGSRATDVTASFNDQAGPYGEWVEFNTTPPLSGGNSLVAKAEEAKQPQVGGYDGYRVSGEFVRMPFSSALTSTDWKGFAYVYGNSATEFGVWAHTIREPTVPSLNRLHVGVFGRLIGPAGTAPVGAAGTSASYSGGAIGLIAAEDMNSVWTGEVELDANFGPTPTIGGTISGPKIGNIRLIEAEINTSFKGTATMGNSTGAWSGEFGANGAHIAGILGVGPVMGGYAARKQ